MLCLLCALVASKTKYTVVVDCGSSGSRPYVYKYNDKDKYPDIKYIDHKKIKIPLTNAADDDNVIPELVSQIYKFTKKKIEKSSLDDTPIYVYATAGMRLLPKLKQDQIMSDLKKELSKQTKFIVKKKHIKVITGTDEGLFLWLALNDLIYKFNGDSAVGALDFGGASAQITLETEDNYERKDDVDYFSIDIKDQTYPLFSHSFLGVGLMESDKTIKEFLINESSSTTNVIENPCYFEGYEENYLDRKIIGKTNYDKCETIIKSVLIPKFKGVTIPKYNHKITKFYAVGNFADYVLFASVSEDIKLNQLKDLSKYMCKLNYDEAFKRSQEDTATFCLSGILQYNILKDGYGFSDEDFVFTKKINGIKSSWTLGALINDLYNIEKDVNDDENNEEEEESYQQNNNNVKIWVIGSVIAGIVIIALVTFLVIRSKKERKTSKYVPLEQL
ncbi:nucleoside phosphatase GDA1/CD39 [Histomonas meleagridis]|uniref:nucleoside phosphatase GDA1/CD39 n=1 Tax=Histomonas meleagridis TaxID=135588 RepID=UPI00355ABE3D|nr:nucleoside phosphatase GDA1/CD39 [Histomonas meleagridis]KAH0802123.1 nucleoside phosphatase GDA1/CD39 [Histomonas meleagridis]